MFWAACVAMLAQWGTTGPAIIIAYFTPTPGFGCRSSSYLAYGVASTAVFLLLTLSMVLSHYAMKGYQDAHVAATSRASNSVAMQCRLDVSRRHKFVCALANLTRLLGKVLAVVNSGVLLLTGLVECLGMFDSCWCESCYASHGEGGYAVTVGSDENYRMVAQGAWIGGIGMATVVSVGLLLIFYFSSTAKLERNASR